MGNPVVRFEIAGIEGTDLRDFYARAFGWKIDTNNPVQYGIVETGAGRGIGGGLVGADPQTGQRVTLYVEVPSVDEHLRRIEAAGGETVIAKVVIPNLITYALFRDPAGNTLGVVEATRVRDSEAPSIARPEPPRAGPKTLRPPAPTNGRGLRAPASRVSATTRAASAGARAAAAVGRAKAARPRAESQARTPKATGAKKTRAKGKKTRAASRAARTR